MTRTLIYDLKNHLGEKIILAGRILNLRRLGNLSFALISDYTGQAQTVWSGEFSGATGDFVQIKGRVVEDKRAKSGIEIQGEEFKIISATQTLPIDLSKNDLKLQLNTLLDYRPLSLRHPKIQAIFKLYDLLLEGYESVMRRQGFTEIKSPKLLEAASEGGANFFEVSYFDRKAFLAQSPQFYKQIMVGVFERVFEINPAFRAEPHFTTRHVNEYTSFDAEMGMISDFYDVTKMLNNVLVEIFSHLRAKGEQYYTLYKTEFPMVPREIPHIKLAEIKKIIAQKYNYTIPPETDIDPQGERLAGRYAKEEFNSDFIFITHYPWKDKPFYTLPSKEDPEETCGYDLIFRGVELATGSQRIHNYEELIKNMKKKDVSPKGMEFYLDVFKYGMPPHGGWGLGSERLIQLLLGLESVKEAVLFPRDVKRLGP